MAPRLVSHTFAALLVDEDFVLITATKKTLVAQDQWSGKSSRTMEP
jgi:hypothetical protein